MFRYASVLSLVFAFSFAPTRTIPKPLKQHTLFKKDNPSCRVVAASEDQSALLSG